MNLETLFLWYRRSQKATSYPIPTKFTNFFLLTEFNPQRKTLKVLHLQNIDWPSIHHASSYSNQKKHFYCASSFRLCFFMWFLLPLLMLFISYLIQFWFFFSFLCPHFILYKFFSDYNWEWIWHEPYVLSWICFGE